MKILSRKLIAGFLLVTLITGIFSLPAAASVTTAEKNFAAALTSSGEETAAEGRGFVEPAEDKVLSAVDTNLTWKQFDGGWRIQAPNGKFRKGFVEYKGQLYFFDSKGYLKTGFFKVNGKTYYASCAKGYMGKGQILTGLWKVGRHFYFLDPASKPQRGVMSFGFQEIKGRRYYFDSKGRMVTGWFTVSGDKYYASCNKSNGHYGAILTGIQKIGKTTYRLDEYSGKKLGTAYKNSSNYMHMIDVSEHNGNIDFNKVKAAGVKAVIIRAGFGDCDVDKWFYSNIKKAKAAGLRIGIYWFSYAYTKQQAITEANFCLRVIKKYNLNLPVYFDWEDDSMRYALENGAKPNRGSITAMTEVFCNTVTRAGRRAGYYFNLAYLKSYYDTSKLKKYSTWYAYWGNNLFTGNIWLKADMIPTPKRSDLWQFSAVGRIDGIKGVVDCDLLLNPSILK